MTFLSICIFIDFHSSEAEFGMLRRIAVRYRTIQILNRVLNNVWRKPGMPVAIGGVAIAEAAALFIILTSVSRLPVPVLVLFSMVAIDFFVVIHVLFNILSYTFVSSVKFVDLKKRGRRTSKWLRAFMKSCSPLKLSMGDGKFFDRLTSFVIWRHCVDMLITFLLM